MDPREDGRHEHGPFEAKGPDPVVECLTCGERWPKPPCEHLDWDVEATIGPWKIPSSLRCRNCGTIRPVGSDPTPTPTPTPAPR